MPASGNTKKCTGQPGEFKTSGLYVWEEQTIQETAASFDLVVAFLGFGGGEFNAWPLQEGMYDKQDPPTDASGIYWKQGVRYTVRAVKSAPGLSRPIIVWDLMLRFADQILVVVESDLTGQREYWIALADYFADKAEPCFPHLTSSSSKEQVGMKMSLVEFQKIAAKVQPPNFYPRS